MSRRLIFSEMLGSTPSLKLVDISTQRNLLATLKGHTGSVYSVTFSPDGTILASGSWDNTVRLWDVVTQTSIATLYMNRVNSVAFSPDGTMLVSGSSDQTVKLWDVATRAEVATFEIDTGSVHSLVFSPDGTLLAYRSTLGTVKLLGVATGAEVATFEAQRYGVLSVVFSPDGTTLASGIGGGAISFWDVSRYVTPVVYMPDANLRVVIRDALGKSRFAPITTTDMASLTTLDASNRNIRDLTGLEFATNLTELNLMDNRLSSLSVTAHIPALQDRGVGVLSNKTPTPDFDGDGVVGFADFLLFVAQFGSSEDDEGYDVRFDLDGDGVIGFGDFLILVNAFGKKVS